MTRRNVFSFKRCLRVLSRYYAVNPREVVGNRKHHYIVAARQHLFWILRNERSDLSYPQIGRMVDKDHSTVMTGEKRFAEHNPTIAIAYVNNLIWEDYNDEISQTETTGPDEPADTPDSDDDILRDKPAAYTTV